MATELNNDGSVNAEGSLRLTESEDWFRNENMANAKADAARVNADREHAKMLARRYDEDREYARPAAAPVHRLAPLPEPQYNGYRYVTPSVPYYYY